MKKFKPLLYYKDKSFIQNVTLKLNEVCDGIIIVTGYNANYVEENVTELNILSKIEFVYNPDYRSGMFTSLRAGLQKANNCKWVLYHFVDQPGLPDKFYNDFIKQINDEYNWIQPSVKGEKGHPILIYKDLFELIINASKDLNLREISKNSIVKKKFWECNYKEIFQDIDTEEDYLSLE